MSDDPSLRLKAARIRSGKTPSEIAAATGITTPSYYDLESHADDFRFALSLRQLARLCSALQLSSALLFADEYKGERIAVSDLSSRTRQYLKDHSIGVEEFSAQVGYDIAPALENPVAIWDWNIDGLRAVCLKLGINWLNALPE